MTITAKDVSTLANLAYLDGHENELLTTEINAILDFVQQLKTVNTSGIAPLLHPMDLQQRLRLDKVAESDCSAQLAEIAPEFDANLYLVPNVFDDDAL